MKGRLETLKVHSKDVHMDESVDLEAIALASAGLVGSDLANMINEAAINAVKHNRKFVNQSDLFEAFEIVAVGGKEKKDRAMSNHEKKIVSYHEVGHAMVTALQKNTEPVQKITIVPRTMGALGYTLQTPEEEKFLETKDELIAKITTYMAGRAAEELVFHSATSGAANDIENATKIARAMITQFGMSDKFGMMSLASVDNAYLDGAAHLNCGDETAAQIDEEVRTMIHNCYQEAYQLLEENREVLDHIADYLYEHETITGKEFMKIFRELKGLPDPDEEKKEEEDQKKRTGMTFNIKEELKKLPDQPGVYIMHDASDAIIYVGKAVSLRNRVRQYFQACHDEGIKKDQMVKKITRFEYIITDSELEALVLECNLIKEYRPKYNTMLRDDKTYPYIKVTLGEEFPRVLFCRQLKKDKSRYFGPYTSAGAVKDTIDLLKKIYHLRTCNRVLPRDIGKERPCLNYHIHQCQAPCQGYISKEEYREKINQAVDFLNGNYQPVLKELEERMMQASENMDFERAIEYRELLNSVKQVAQKQKITSSDGEDKDIIALAADERDAVVQVFFIRSGRLIGREHFYVTIANEDSKEQILTTFLKQFYSGTPYIPKEIMLQYAVEDAAVIEDWLTKKRGQKVVLRVPQKGMKEKLVELAEKNAALVLSQDREKLKREEGRTIGAMKEIASWLDLEKLERVEAYDISNINGFETVGSMVVYEKGKPQRSDYRKFKLRTITGPDDYASMHEVLTRRFTHGQEERKILQKKGWMTNMGDLQNSRI